MGKGRAWMWRSRRKRPGTQPERRGYSYREMGEGSQRPSKPNGQQAYGKDTQICVSNQENTSLSLANMTVLPHKYKGPHKEGLICKKITVDAVMFVVARLFNGNPCVGAPPPEFRNLKLKFAAKDVCGHHSRLHPSDATCETCPVCAAMRVEIWRPQQCPRDCSVGCQVQKWLGAECGEGAARPLLVNYSCYSTLWCGTLILEVSF